MHFLVIIVRPGCETAYRLFSTETRAYAYAATLPKTSNYEIRMLREDAE